MSMMQYWLEQRKTLRNAIHEQATASEAIHQVRHALLQTEQNALAELGDDLLRQQASVLMSCLKGSLGLLEAHTAGQIWTAQKSGQSGDASISLWLYALAAAVLLLIWCSLKEQWIAVALGIAALALGFAALVRERKAASAILPRDEVRASVRVDTERMLGVLDGQLRAMDRYLTDFSYLNDQARGNAESADPITLSRAADLLEALYDWNESERAPAEEAARSLLGRMGLQAVDYSKESSRLFNTLPSKSTTRTLSPAIVSTEDQRLLRRGTAAVRIDAA